MDQQEGRLVRHGMTVFFGLARGALDGDDHIAQEMRVRQRRSRLLGKGENIGGAILLQVLAVEPPYGPIIDEEDRDLIPRFAQDG